MCLGLGAVVCGCGYARGPSQPEAGALEASVGYEGLLLESLWSDHRAEECAVPLGRRYLCSQK